MSDRGEHKQPGVGVGVIVERHGKLLLVRRSTHGAGSWSTPGGYLDPGEHPEECAIREVCEETGVRITDVHFRAISNDVHDDGKHNVTIWLSARHDGGDDEVASPEELDAVGWFPWDALPEPLYLSTRNFLQGRTYPPDVCRQVLPPE